jgi:hypothetical protein
MLTVINRRPSDVFQNDRTNSVTIGVADEYIGLVVGRGGRNIMEISQVFYTTNDPCYSVLLLSLFLFFNVEHSVLAEYQTISL